MLDTNGFEVHYLGVDVPAQKLIDEIKEIEDSIVGLGAFLTLPFNCMKTTIEAIKAAGLIGGG